MILGESTLKLIGFLSVLPLSLLLEGIRRKILAMMQNRVGPPIHQPFYDILKLFGKGKSDSRAKKNTFFNIIPILYFLATYSLFLFVPFHIVRFEYDFILLIYIIVLSSALYVIAGFASNSPLGIIGSMRESMLMVCYEMVFTVSFLTFVVFSGISSLANFPQTLILLRLPVASICLFSVVLLETRVTPFDTIEAPTEIMGSVETEYSGKGLAFIELAKYLKLVFFSFLTAMLFFGFSNYLFLATSLVIMFVLIFCQATTPRYKLNQTFNIFLILLLLAVIEFVRIKFIVW